MRRSILNLAVAVVCSSVALAQHGRALDRNAPEKASSHSRIETTQSPADQQAAFDATNLGSPLMLDKGWRVGISANPAAAQPDFDDSGWAVRDAHGLMDDVPDEDQPSSSASNAKGPPPSNSNSSQRRYAWFRLHIKLASAHGPLSLLMELPVSQNASLGLGGTEGPGADVFANGNRIGPEGPHGDAPQHYQQISRIYNLNLPPDETSLTLVIRTIYIPVGYSSYTSFFANRKLQLGHQQDLERSLQLWSDRNLFERLPRLVDSILLIVLAGFLFALYFAQRDHSEYLWLALHELLQAPIGFVELAGSSARLDSLIYAAVVLELVLVSAYFYFEFLIAFVGLRPRKWYIRLHIKVLRWSSPVLVAVGPSLLLVGHSPGIAVVLAIGLVFSLLWMLGWLIFILATLVIAAVRKNVEAGLLLIPLILTGLGILEPMLSAGMSDISGHAYSSPLSIQAGAIPIHFASIADFTGILVIVIIIFSRFLRIHRDQERATNELAAARSVQELMIPREKVATPGFEVDSVYDPANEVGGDFFHVQSTGDGGLLVVIGDVAGKGLKAAMNVSMLMGALRRTSDQCPGKILASLNRVLTGSESFTTCLVAVFYSSGELVLANAGHIHPYLNSQEISLPSGLPLGVLPEMNYEEARLYLHPGDRMLLLSDGVVEARRASGELFGFDRVHNLTNQSAFYVAEVAKDFGQQDDITVLTVRRLPQTKAA